MITISPAVKATQSPTSGFEDEAKLGTSKPKPGDALEGNAQVLSAHSTICSTMRSEVRCVGIRAISLKKTPGASWRPSSYPATNAAASLWEDARIQGGDRTAHADRDTLAVAAAASVVAPESRVSRLKQASGHDLSLQRLRSGAVLRVVVFSCCCCCAVRIDDVMLKCVSRITTSWCVTPTHQQFGTSRQSAPCLPAREAGSTVGELGHHPKNPVTQPSQLKTTFPPHPSRSCQIGLQGAFPFRSVMKSGLV